MPNYWKQNFNTKLTDENERRYQNWINGAKTKYGVDLSRDDESYDLRGYWLNGGYEDEAFRKRKGHAPDTYKKPNHPTFSNESIYHNTKAPDGSVFQGGEWVDEYSFKPSQRMIQTTHTNDWYPDHMKKYGEGVKILNYWE